MTRFLFTLILTVLLFTSAIAQKVSFDPTDWSGADTLTITVDLSGTALSGTTEDLYLWAWAKRGFNQDVDSPFNGTWGTSLPASKLNFNKHLLDFLHCIKDYNKLFYSA